MVSLGFGLCMLTQRLANQHGRVVFHVILQAVVALIRRKDLKHSSIDTEMLV